MSVTPRGQHAQPLPSSMTQVLVNDSTGNMEVVPAIADQRVYVWGVFLLTDGVTDLTFKSAANDISGPLGFGVNSGPSSICLDIPPGRQDSYTYAHYVTNVGEALNLTSSGIGVRVAGTVWVSQGP